MVLYKVRSKKLYTIGYSVDTINNQLKNSLMVLLFYLLGNCQQLLVAAGAYNRKQVIESISFGPNCRGFFLICFRKGLAK